jgi:hypothetical protein
MYQIKLPSNIEQVPATVAKAVSDNAVVSVQKALNLASYDAEDRSTVYTVTAESDTTSQYVLEWQREQLPFDIQPYPAEPFVSEYVGRYYFGDNFLEVCNPGNVPLDLSNYMFVTAFTTNPAEAIAAEPAEWTQRYIKYIPGYKWVDSTTWATQPWSHHERLVGIWLNRVERHPLPGHNRSRCQFLRQPGLYRRRLLWLYKESMG